MLRFPALIAAVVVLTASACSAPATDDGGTGGGGGIINAGGGPGGGGGAGGGTGAGTTTGGGSTGGGATGGGGTGGGSTGTHPAGDPCASDGDCQSGQCLAWFRDAGSVCVKTCFDQTDCASLTNSYCGAARDGGGVCVPRSPAHCLPCQFDQNCGALAEACVIGPGETAMTCRVDCSLAGAAACPSDYTCTPLQFNGQMRSFCLPPSTCDQSQGGFCDRYAIGQPCENSNDAGTCTGARSCMQGRYTTCDALVPACKASCSTADRTGCTERLCDSATSTADHCGSCSNVCPGFGVSSAVVSCADAGCTFACNGERYDVDNSPDSGCEVADAPTGNHVVANATSVGSLPCNDSSTLNTSGKMPSDVRAHVPAIGGFDAMKGAAPDMLSLNATGGALCQNDIGITFTVTGGAPLNCFRLSIETDKGIYGCDTNASGTCSISSGSGSYSDNSTIRFTVSRTCAAAGSGGNYTISGHF